MSYLRSLGLLSFVPVPAVMAACGVDPVPDSTATVTADIFGGFPATSAVFDAVGDIAEVLGPASDGSIKMDAKCTGVLVGPHSVLTAAHCLFKYGLRNSFKYTEQYFRIGADSSRPREQVRIVGFVEGPSVTGGSVGFGQDLAVLQLASDIADVPPMPIGAPLGSADVGNRFVSIGYGRQSVTEAVGTFDLRAFGTMQLIALQGNPLQAQWPTISDFVAYLQQFDPAITADGVSGIWSAPETNVIAGQQAYFSGVGSHGVQPCSGDSGGPILRSRNNAFEIVGIVSGGFKDGNRCVAGEYYGLPNTPEATAFLQGQLADPTRGVAHAGYCNAATAIRSTTPAESPDPIAVFPCQDFGLVCRTADEQATCVEPITSGPATACSVVGDFQHPRARFGFTSDGRYTANGAPFGTYTFANGLLTLRDTSCPGTPGIYALQFSADCNTATMEIAADPCELRAEAFDDFPMIRLH